MFKGGNIGRENINRDLRDQRKCGKGGIIEVKVGNIFDMMFGVLMRGGEWKLRGQ